VQQPSPSPNPPRFDLDPSIADHVDEHLSVGFGIADLPLICLATVRTAGGSTWSREEIYADDDRASARS
jgi:hypothetical protein